MKKSILILMALVLAVSLLGISAIPARATTGQVTVTINGSSWTYTGTGDMTLHEAYIWECGNNSDIADASYYDYPHPYPGTTVNESFQIGKIWFGYHYGPDGGDDYVSTVYGSCFQGYVVPHVLLYTSAELKNGYGILVSTQPFASVESIMRNFGLTSIPADLKEICEGSVSQMNASDVQGTWVCDYLLVDILPYGRPGGRLPLINANGNSLQKVYEKILSWIAP
jgi:hypothetical protein